MPDEQIKTFPTKQLKQYLDDLEVWLSIHHFHYMASVFEQVREKVKQELQSREENGDG